MHEPFKRMSWFPAAFHVTLREGISADLHSQMLLGLLFLALILWAGESVVELGPFTPQGRPQKLRYFSCFSTAIYEYGASLF